MLRQMSADVPDTYDDLSRRVLEAAPVVIVVLGIDGSILHFNPYFERLTGYALDEVRGHDWFTMFLPERDRDRIRALFTTSLGSERVRGNVNPIVTRAGDEREIEWTDEMLVDDAGRTRALLAVGHDVTERVQAERARQALEARQRTVFDATFALVGVFDLEGRVLDVSSAALEAVGVRLENLVGVKFDPTPWLGHSEEALRTFRSGLERAMRGETVREEIRVRVGDRFVDFKGVLGPVRNHDGEIEAVFGAGIDITSSVATREQLRLSELRLSEAHRLARLGAWHNDLVTREVWWSEEQYRINGIAVGTPVNFETFLALIHPDDRASFDAQFRDVLDSGRAEGDFRIVRPDGSVRYVHGIAQTAYDDHRRPVRLTGTNQDITESVLTDQALRESEQRSRQLVDELRTIDRRKNDFIAMLSHELRNPLSALRTGVDVLHATTTRDDDRARRAAAIVDRQVTQLTRLVDDLLDVTRITEGKIQLQRARVDLADLVRAVADDHRPQFAQREVELQVDLAGPPAVVDGDAARLTQAIGNLLHNALKFTSAGEHTTVTVSRDAAANRAVVRVTDTGSGIDPAMLATVFDPFVQDEAELDRSKGGLGLGLALVKGIVELHGGEIAARSEGRGRGSEFEFWIPLVAERAARQDPASAPAVEAPRPGRRVLVIEDNLDAAEALRDLLELDHHIVAVAHDGATGLRLAGEFLPEIVLCDIGLPGISGYDVARELARDERLRSASLIALSGYATPSDVETAHAAGFTRHLAKPPSLEELRGLLATAARS